MEVAHQPSPVFYFDWYYVVLSLISFSTIVLVTLEKYRLYKALLLALFVMRVLGEAAVSTRDQFPTTAQPKLALSFATLLIAFIIVAVTLHDVYQGLSNYMPKRGRRVVPLV